MLLFAGRIVYVCVPGCLCLRAGLVCGLRFAVCRLWYVLFCFSLLFELLFLWLLQFGGLFAFGFVVWFFLVGLCVFCFDCF